MLAMLRGSSEQRLEGLEALDVQMDVVLPGVADAAVDLDALLGDESLAVAGGRFRDARRQLPPAVVLGDGHGSEVGGGAGLLEADEHVGELVLDGLERADGTAELLPLLRVLQGEIEEGLGHCRPAPR